MPALAKGLVVDGTTTILLCCGQQATHVVDRVQRRSRARQNELSGSVRREYSDSRRDEVDEQNGVDAVPGLQRSGNRQSVSLLLVSFLLKVMRREIGLQRVYLHR